jgi:electron transfer flavoprotein alpha subunit
MLCQRGEGLLPASFLSGRLRIAILVKLVPHFEAMQLGPDGRLQRDGLELELNPYCRRAVSKGVELAAAAGGICTVFSLGPPQAQDVLREAVAWGADEGVLITDPAFAGSDTLATARALAAALRREGPWDLILTGRNSVDADTGQVPPEVAELLGLPFLAGVREVELDTTTSQIAVRCEHDDGYVRALTRLPVLLSCAERLCTPAKVNPEGRAAVPGCRIRSLTAAELGDGPWGQQGSPTRVGQIRLLEVQRQRVMLSGSVQEQVVAAVELLRDRGALNRTIGVTTNDRAPEETVAAADGDGPVVVVIVEPFRADVTRELLGGAARLASALRGCVVAIGPPPIDTSELGPWGANAAVVLAGATVEEDVASAVAAWCLTALPWAVLAAGTMWGREVASRVAARLGAGLIGDAVDLDVQDGRLLGWKPAFGGRLVAAITATSTVQMATVRPGVLARLRPREPVPVATTFVDVEPAGRIQILESGRDDDLNALARAETVVGVGTGVHPNEYPALGPLLAVLGAELAATRKVTDKGWLPHARQVGITGRSIGPRLYVAIGMSGAFNHVVGVRGAGSILAINSDPDALVFDSADAGIVADWRVAIPLLAAALQPTPAASAS